MGSIAVILPASIGEKPRELVELVGLPSETEHVSKELSGAANELIHAVVKLVDGMVLHVLDQRTVDAFLKTREDVFPQYFAAMVALGALVRIAVPKRDLTRLRAESLSELEAEFRDSGSASFGSDLCSRALFTVWTLRKINDLAEEVERVTIANNIAEKDGDFARRFAAHAMWARFHIDCLVKSIRSGKPIFPDIMDSVVDGLRAAVNAYAWIRQAVDLREGCSEPLIPPIEWGREDEFLLQDSMRDLAREDF
jgi:hypothetical protein